ncbi:GGDEF domain-containing protein [Pelagibacterium sp. 26DY04]|uniref:GGDEF domain-containing protein n=1 Tax=Pelagibacterium sp. 26DY04 TaxID=2967130 RepID=UPI0028159566|nr:GGDEF domain-containing protein [Pelagibacterium sp. 26DY04]WMT86917.1 GGDEF domain-containing protein [Pelagibacterium sp. 26DY04]
MNGAILVFWVIVALCAVKSAAFFALARFDPVNRPALWFSGAFLAAGISFLGEIVLATGFAPGPTRMVIAVAMVIMFVLIAHGIARRYRIDMPAGGGLAIVAASSLLYYLILDLPRADFTRQMLYQIPYALLSFLALSVISRARSKAWYDWLFMALFALIGLHFLGKPFLARWAGGVGAEPSAFSATLYAGLSTASGAILLLILSSAGLALLLADTAGRLIRRAERDAQTGLLNRAGFATHADRQLLTLAQAEKPHEERRDVALTLIAVNRPTQPRTREQSAAALAALILSVAPRDALIGRMADFEFAILAPGSNLFAARHTAEELRKKLRARLGEMEGGLTLSIGITEREPGDLYADLLARGLWALEEAERAGGNCVRLAAHSQFDPLGIRQG